jgi:NAD(P)H-nitrite reductase large subunit
MKIVIIGAGPAGVTVAETLRQYDDQSEIVMLSSEPFPPYSPPAMVEYFKTGREVHLWKGHDFPRRLDIDYRQGAEAVAVRSGDVVAADLLIAATGLRPNIEFLEGSGIRTKWGVLVDEHLRTNYPDIYAAGDVVETFDRFSGERYVHAIFPNAVNQARIVAYNLLGWDVAYEGSDSMNSLKHLGLPVMAVGRMEGQELRQRRDGILRKIYLQDDRIVGFRLAGDVTAAGIYRSLMNKQVDVGRFKHRLLERGFGMGLIEGSARAALPLT